VLVFTEYKFGAPLQVRKISEFLTLNAMLSGETPVVMLVLSVCESLVLINERLFDPVFATKRTPVAGSSARAEGSEPTGIVASQASVAGSKTPTVLLSGSVE